MLEDVDLDKAWDDFKYSIKDNLFNCYKNGVYYVGSSEVLYEIDGNILELWISIGLVIKAKKYVNRHKYIGCWQIDPKYRMK